MAKIIFVIYIPKIFSSTLLDINDCFADDDNDDDIVNKMLNQSSVRHSVFIHCFRTHVCIFLEYMSMVKQTLFPLQLIL